MSAEPATQLFSFCQFELPSPLGLPDGRYLMRRPGAPPQEPAAHVLVFTTLNATTHRRLRKRRRLAGDSRQRISQGNRASDSPISQGNRAAIPLARATVIDVGEPLPEPAGARRWLAAAGEQELADGLAVLNRALHAFRLVVGDPYVQTVSRRQALVARIGYGAGEQVADGRWSEAVELRPARARTRRAGVLEPQAQLAAALGGRRAPLVCEELALRARLDLGQGRDREAALQLLVALDAALAELPAEALAEPRTAAALAERVAQLSTAHGAVAAAARAALAERLSNDDRQVVESTLARLEAALRARAAALAKLGI
ncbi:MAG: hypothetical protein ACLP0J_21550 [Solirubrobacteraceae bacterium]